jgi:hypothetical protein
MENPETIEKTKNEVTRTTPKLSGRGRGAVNSGALIAFMPFIWST